MKIANIVGARPQFIKLAPLSSEIREDFEEVIIHTGQHYDVNMSRSFFETLQIPKPDYNLEVGSGSQSAQTGKMLKRIEDVLSYEQPDLVIVYGDTNSTLAGAISSSKSHIPVGHMEAGLRSFNRQMPEEINRICTDKVSKYLFCPTPTAIDNLQSEGIERGIFLIGDLMFEALKKNIQIARQNSSILENLNVKDNDFCLLTIHRAENTNCKERLKSIIAAFEEIDREIIFPAHPRFQKYLHKYKLDAQLPDNIRLIDPVDYLDILILQENAEVIFTDSGGMQKEALWLKTPCITLRDETEWIELIQLETNTLVGADTEKIIDNYKKMKDLTEFQIPDYYEFDFQKFKSLVS